MQEEYAPLAQAIEQEMGIAHRLGLDFFEMRFELVPARIIYAIGAHGMPVRFQHWSFGKAYTHMKLGYDLGLSKIYELVINTDPCYAYLVDSNSLVENMTVAAHVLGHSDFFKNNAYFAGTSRQMTETMEADAQRFSAYEARYGRQAVEEIVDAALALSLHVSPHSDQNIARWRQTQPTLPPPKTPYDDLFEAPGTQPVAAQPEGPLHFPSIPEPDLLLFIAENSHVLNDWQKDVVNALRAENLYFLPQLGSKIMNEGWAALWHARIMREMDLTEAQTMDFAKLHAAILAPQPGGVNPYLLGMRLWESIEDRYDHPDRTLQEAGVRSGAGREKIFEVRQTENDVSFLRNYLTRDLVEELDLYLYQRVGDHWQVVDKDWQAVRDRLVSNRSNNGIPVIEVQDGDYNRNGELYLLHRYEGVALDRLYAEKTLPYVWRLWGRTVHLQTVQEGKPVCATFDGHRCTWKLL